MSDTKKKYFTFQEKELKWIDPLLHEWSRKEGKPYSELILQLLEDYRDRGSAQRDAPPLRDTLDMATSSMKGMLSDYSTRSKEALDDVMEKSMDGLQTVQDKLKTGGTRLMEQIRRVESNVRTRLEEAKAEKE